MAMPLRSTFAVVLLVAGTAAAQDIGGGPGLAWLEGRWCGGDASTRVEETWLPDHGDMHFGVSRTVRDGRVVAFEFLRITVVDGTATYLAQPGGRPPTAFARTDGGEHWVRFENPQHDFPTRIEYRRTGDSMTAEIAGPGRDGQEQAIAFEFRRCPDRPQRAGPDLSLR
jgi:hypothetical protein